MIIVTLIAAGFLGISLAMLFRPETYYRVAMRYVQWRWMAPVESASRGALGVLLLFAADTAAYPRVVNGLGWLMLFIGVGLALVPPAQHRRFGVWVVNRIRPWLRPLGVLGVGLAAALYVAGAGIPG
ncbi:MAG: hypothetical protein R3270_06530 [Gammaproteobacteria bacterium]|nr:hypothetical protein [Gammaproteobacteria bacterium]